MGRKSILSRTIPASEDSEEWGIVEECRDCSGMCRDEHECKSIDPNSGQDHSSVNKPIYETMAMEGHIRKKDLGLAPNTETEEIGYGASTLTWEAFELPMYAGKRDPDAVQEWVYKMEAFLNATGKSDMQRMIYASNYLTGTAHAWWRNVSGFAKTSRSAIGWKEFKKLILHFFTPPTYMFKLREEWSKLQQSDLSVEEYDEWFMGFYVRLPEFSIQDHLNKYVEGLREEIRANVSLFKPESLKEAMRLAGLIENQIQVADHVNGDEGKVSSAKELSSKNGGVKKTSSKDDVEAGICQGKRREWATDEKLVMELNSLINRKETPRVRPSKANKKAQDNEGEDEDEEVSHSSNSSDDWNTMAKRQGWGTNQKRPRMKASAEYGDNPDIKLCFVTPREGSSYKYRLNVNVKNMDACAVINSNSDNFISEHLVEKLKLPTVECKPFLVQNLEGYIGGIGRFMVLQLPFSIQSFKGKMDFAVINISQPDMILGRPWLRKIDGLKYGKDGVQFHSRKKKYNLSYNDSTTA